MTLHLRQITLADTPAFRDCLDTVARECRYLAQIEAPSLERMTEFVEGSVAQNIAQFVLIDGRQLVGWCDIFPHWAASMQHTGVLGMGLLPSHRGRGLGERLLRATLDHALAQGVFRVTLEARSDNLRAIRLYERMGFVHEGVGRCALFMEGRYHDAVRMALLQGPAAAHLTPPPPVQPSPQPL